VIIAFVTQASLAARKATSTVPIVMVAVGDPVAAGLVASLTRPGGNVTGNSSNSVEVAGKSIEILTEVAPERRRVAILWNPANAVFQTQMLKESEAASRRRGLQARAIAASDAGTIERAFQSLAAKGRLPSVSGLREYAEAGGLVVYGPNFYELYRGAAAYVDRILQGARPRDLPVEQPTKFELVINLKTARALGLTIPPSLQQRADQVIE
jgi:ABC-type uncharacterized transport system substrate-binding protein